MLEITKPSTPVLIQDLGMLYANCNSKNRIHYGIYKCSCGISFKAQDSNIKNGHTLSCGCYKKQRIKEGSLTHGMRWHPIYSVWASIFTRTTSENQKQFKDYGGRGIKVCDRWKDINNFIEDMYPSYKKGLSIDRINNDGNYEPTNCRWTNMEIQGRNTRLLRSNNTSGYRGAYFNKNINKWISSIKVSYKQIYLGCFNTSLEAAIAYDNYVLGHKLEHTINFKDIQ